MDLFSEWYAANGDWAKVIQSVERKAAKNKTALNRLEAMKKKELLALYSTEKAWPRCAF